MQNHFARLVIIFIVAGSLAAQQKAKPTSPVTQPASATTVAELPSEETVNAFLRHMFGYDTSITWKIVDIRPAAAPSLAQVNVLLSNPQGQQVTALYVTPDGSHALVGDLIPFGADPFAPARQKLQKDSDGVSRGPTNASVTLNEFSDLQCPHCKEAQPIIEKLLADEPSVRFVFRQFPLPSHDWAAKAAAYADCIGRANNSAFWKFVDATYAAQTDITQANAEEKLTGLADSSGVKGADIAACAAKPDTKTRLDKSVALGQSVDVTGTPSLFINGRKISSVTGIPYDLLKKMVEFAASSTK
jgi:protein-disulfide isomerase